MSRSIVLSNGQLAVALDAHAQVRDIYYPHVGLEDHVRGHYVHRVGVWVDGRISWFSEDSAWEISISCEEDALASIVTARNRELGVDITLKDIVFHERPVFIRRVTVTNKSDREREIKLYFSHQFEIYKAHGSDTAYFDPLSHTIVHYKGMRVFQIGATLDGTPFQDYATGRMNFYDKEGSHRDADDGILSKNAIEHGPADSILGLYAPYAPDQSRTAYYSMSAGQSIAGAEELHDFVTKKTPEYVIKASQSFWNAWLGTYQQGYDDLAPDAVRIFKQSLMHMRAHVDIDGGILASCDSDMLQYGLDTYSYVWPRDAAYTAMALDAAGSASVSRRFFEFCRDTISHDGYFMHKYLPDKSLGSSWHPWIADGQVQLPIQEDETALVLVALRDHYARSRDLEFLEAMFAPLVEKAADFLVRFRDPKTGLPEPSYDLWERKRGTSTYTSSAVYGALMAAAELSKILGKDSHEARYRSAAMEVREGILKHLWDEKTGAFLNMISTKAGHAMRDATIDISSVYGVFSFGVLPVADPKLERAWDISVRVLSQGIPTGGVARFENDDYYRIEGPSPGNPWIITTLWYAEYLLARAKSESDLSRVRETFDWVVRHALPSGVLSEQLNPKTGEQVCAAPLTWAHAAYVTTVLKYLDALKTQKL